MATVEMTKDNFEKVIKQAKALDMAKVHQEIAARDAQDGQQQS